MACRVPHAAQTSAFCRGASLTTGVTRVWGIVLACMRVADMSAAAILVSLRPGGGCGLCWDEADSALRVGDAARGALACLSPDIDRYQSMAPPGARAGAATGRCHSRDT